jgi:acyl-CoA thioesterase FadM
MPHCLSGVIQRKVGLERTYSVHCLSSCVYIGGVWLNLPDKAVAEEMHTIWNSSAVMRATTATVSARAEDLHATDQVRISAWLSRLGNTSWDISFLVEDEASGQPLATVLTTMVNVTEDDTSKTMPVPHKEMLTAAVLPKVELSWEPVASSRTAAAFVWDTSVRLTDCDGMGHINNALYASLAEEARGMAAHSNSYQGEGNKLATELANTIFVDYQGQIGAYERLQIATWYEEIDSTYRFEFSGGEGAGELIAAVVLGVDASLGHPRSVL